jgi:hypothetical protein
VVLVWSCGWATPESLARAAFVATVSLRLAADLGGRAQDALPGFLRALCMRRATGDGFPRHAMPPSPSHVERLVLDIDPAAPTALEDVVDTSLICQNLKCDVYTNMGEMDCGVRSVLHSNGC